MTEPLMANPHEDHYSSIVKDNASIDTTLVRGTDEAKRKLDDSSAVVAYGLVSSNIYNPVLQVYIGRDEQSTVLDQLLPEFGDLPVKIQSSPITRKERDQLIELVNSADMRDRFAQAGAKIVDVWINGDWRIHVGTQTKAALHIVVVAIEVPSPVEPELLMPRATWSSGPG
jgi:hypothetical protein